jgi:hypothetical protein
MGRASLTSPVFLEHLIINDRITVKYELGKIWKDGVVVKSQYDIVLRRQRKRPEAVTLLICVWKVPGSNIDWNIEYTD